MTAVTGITLNRDKTLLTVGFGDGSIAPLAAEYLRVESPSAEVQGHHPGQKRLVAGKRDVRITGIEPTGNYAVRLSFSDGHETGIFSWAYLHRLAAEHATLWPAYLENLLTAGLSRD